MEFGEVTPNYFNVFWSDDDRDAAIWCGDNVNQRIVRMKGNLNVFPFGGCEEVFVGGDLADLGDRLL